jgi:tetraacyldisaccharide 4'-kinase
VSPVRGLLAPLVQLYRMGLDWRERRLATGKEPVRRLRFPVISVGNLSTGGTGKTPFTIALAQALTGHGFSVDVLSRGYGRRGDAAARVRADGTAEEFGDEPLMIAKLANVPVFVARQRYEAGLLAEAEIPAGARAVHILDDGFQHRQLHREVDILLMDRRDWTDSLLPAGNLREAREAARRADVIVIPATEPEMEAELRDWGCAGPVWRVRRSMTVLRAGKSAPVFAFCGIARPEQFFRGLESAGMEPAGRKAFADHHRYTRGDVRRLKAAANQAGAAGLVTTMKDAVRMGELANGLALTTAGLRVEIEDEDSAVDWLQSRVISPTMPP